MIETLKVSFVEIYIFFMLFSFQAATSAPAKDEFDSDESDFDEEDEEEEEDSDFEDPDLIEVPGGGTSLQTIRNINSKPGGSRPSTSGTSKPKTIDLTGGSSHSILKDLVKSAHGYHRVK
jgi:hypothetical protein